VSATKRKATDGVTPRRLLISDPRPWHGGTELLTKGIVGEVLAEQGVLAGFEQMGGSGRASWNCGRKS
jgi:hypothetical protein